jgi:phytoene/squalene synthetase
LQLANFWQDVARDYALGRVYLPQADLATFGVTAEMLAEQRSTPEFTRLLAFEVDRARGLLRAGAPLPGAFSGRLRLMLELFLQGGLRICQEIESIGWRVWEQRPVVSSAAKRQLIWSSLLRTVGPPWWRGIRPGSAG